MKNIKDFFKFVSLCLILTLGFAFGSEQENAKTFSFVQLCDTQLGFGGYEHDVNSFQIAVKKINELKPDFVLICGDMVNTFDEKSISDFNDIKKDLKVPCYCCPGNHDVGNTPTAESVRKYCDFFGKNYFSFEHKGYTFLMTDTNIIRVPVEEETQKQDSWVKEAITAAHEKKSPVFVIGHHPMFTRTPDEAYGNNSLPVEKRKELLELFEKSGVVAVLTAHTHQFIENDYKGIQLVTGETTSRNLDGRPFGFRLWKVAPDSVKHEFVSLGLATSAPTRGGRR